jgi:cell wall-associated NlpC family hydrolase
LAAVAVGGLLASGMGVAVVAMLLITVAEQGSGQCSAATSGSDSGSIALSSAGSGARVGATEYGGPGDGSSGTVGASGMSLVAHPDSYAELGGYTFQTATAMGGLAYMTPLRISWGRRSAVAYKRDFGFGGGPIDGLPRVIDLWWQFAGALGIPYDSGQWSGPVRVTRTPGTGAGDVLGQAVPPPPSLQGTCAAEPAPGTVALTPGPRARLLPNGRAAAPLNAPAAVKAMIAAGNQIVGKPYLYGGGHGLPLDRIASAYDCSSSVEHLMYGGRLLPVSYDAASGTLESYGRSGPGRWVTIYASADHVFMYVAGLRWDTHNAAGPQDGGAGIGWHPLVRSSAGFVARHPVGL